MPGPAATWATAAAHFRRAGGSPPGCQRIFAEKITGTSADRPELARMIDHLRAGDVVTVTSLDRLARSKRDQRTAARGDPEMLLGEERHPK